MLIQALCEYFDMLAAAEKSHTRRIQQGKNTLSGAPDAGWKN